MNDEVLIERLAWDFKDKANAKKLIILNAAFCGIDQPCFAGDILGGAS